MGNSVEIADMVSSLEGKDGTLDEDVLGLDDVDPPTGGDGTLDGNDLDSEGNTSCGQGQGSEQHCSDEQGQGRDLGLHSSNGQETSGDSTD